MSHADQTPTAAPPGTQATLQVEFLYLDLSTCTRCQGTQTSLRTALTAVQPLLDALGLSAVVRSTQVRTAEQAQQVGLVSSPTIRINGRDIAPEVRESTCGPCSGLCGAPTTCRVWSYQGREFTEPPVGLILAAIVRELASSMGPGSRPSAPPAAVPENLERFFRGAAPSAANTCCTVAEQATCCAAEDKAACCEAAGSAPCGCR